VLKVCITKQNTCYDLYTRSGPDLEAIVESSNWRSGPIGLWEKYDCDVRIVEKTDDPECNVGRRFWEKYVTGWNIWPQGAMAENVEDIDWSIYDVVIAIDVAVPRRIVKRYPDVMWCYYFVEGGPIGIDTIFRGSPFYGYNVFLNHREAKTLLNRDSRAIKSMRKTRRAVLDFPYYLQSATSIQKLYKQKDCKERSGIVLGHHSYAALQQAERDALDRFGGIREGYKKISDIHKLELESRYFIIHPESKRSAGLALVEAISAGCLALSPRNKLWGFPELIEEDLDYSSFSELLSLLDKLEQDQQVFTKALSKQQEKVNEGFFSYPTANLELILDCFRQSRCSPFRQWASEHFSFVKGQAERVIAATIRRL